MRLNQRTRERRVRDRLRDDSGQVTIFVLLVLGLFLLGFVGFAVDMTNLWFHRQTAQGAADAACQAGIMDVLLLAEGSTPPTPGFTPGTAFDCSASSTAAPCKYAALNGYNGAGLAANADSNDVSVTFPASVPGIPICSTTVTTNCLPPSTVAPFPFLHVDLTDRFKLTFASLISGQKTMDVKAKSTCALVLAQVPVPVIIMNTTCPITFSLGGNASMSVVGGPPQSIQDNSGNLTAAQLGTLNLSLGGPNFSGSSFGVQGGPPPTPGGFNGGTTGSWESPHSPISDPFFNLPVPPTPGPPQPPKVDLSVFPIYAPLSNGPGKGWHVPYKAWSCPDLGGCDEYTGGLYTTAIHVKNATAIFDPGVYYITGTVKGNCGNMPPASCWKPTGSCNYGLSLDSNSMVRPSTATGDGSGGTMFYLSGTGAGNYGSVYVDANSGSRAIDPFTTSLATCPGGSPPDARLGLPPTLTGNVSLGPCTGPGGTLCVSSPGCNSYGSTDGLTRGMLFWDNRDNADLNGQPHMAGGGQMLLAGTMYFHNCSSKDGAGLGTSCKPPAQGYNGFFQLQGSPGSSTYILGFMVTDDLSLGGTATVNMSIDPNKKFNILKATMVQ